MAVATAMPQGGTPPAAADSRPWVPRASAAAAAAGLLAVATTRREDDADEETTALVGTADRGRPLAGGADGVWLPPLPPPPLTLPGRGVDAGPPTPPPPAAAACRVAVELGDAVPPGGGGGGGGGRAKPVREMDWSAFARVILVGALQTLAVAMVVPVRPKLLLDALSGSTSRAAAVTGGLSALDAVVEVVSNPGLGHVSDLRGRRGVLLLAQVGLAADLALTAALARHWQAHVAATLISAASGVFFMTLATVTADLAVGTGEEAAAYGALGAAYGVAFAVGPALGGAMAAAVSPVAPFHGAIAAVALNAAAVLWVLPETAPVGRGWLPGGGGGDSGGGRGRGGGGGGGEALCGKAPSTATAANTTTTATASAAVATAAARGGGVASVTINPLPRLRVLFRSSVLRWLGATVAASGVAAGGLGSMLYFYTHARFGWGPSETGRFLSAVGVSMIISQGVLARPAVAVLGERPLILTGYALKAAYLVLYGAARSGGAMYGALGVATLGYAAGPAWKGVLARQAGPDEQGALQGGLAALATVVQPVAPLVATGLFGVFAPRGLPGVPLYVMAALTLGAMAIAAKALSHPQLR